MLTITETASALIRGFVEANGGPTATMRIAALPVEPSANGTRGLGLQLVLHPEGGDEVVEAPGGGAHILVDPQVASLLDDKTLDAAVDESGSASLVLIGPTM